MQKAAAVFQYDQSRRMRDGIAKDIGSDVLWVSMLLYDGWQKCLYNTADSSLSIPTRQDGSKYCINLYDSRLTSLVDDGCGMAWPVDIADVTNYMRVRKINGFTHYLWTYNLTCVSHRNPRWCRQYTWKSSRVTGQNVDQRLDRAWMVIRVSLRMM